ncbi:MAG TPA: hypothetical protein VFH34_01335 [Anaerolineales bacterium]|nr:hypothetical protein [Anaerolineales bacterium]
MIKPSLLQVMLLSFLLASCAGGPANAGAQSAQPEFIVITKNPEDQVDIQTENGAAQIDIQSPTGIGAASFELVSGTMPENITLRLHLTGLEGFRLTSARDQISASVSGEANANTQMILSSGAESPLSPGDPLWIKIEIASSDKNIPLEPGYFEITVPHEFIRSAGTTFEIEWIDFYR